MKKFIFGFILALLMVSFACAVNSFTALVADFPVLINGQELKSDKPPVVINSNTYLPLKVIGDSLGVKVVWNPDLKRVEIGETVPLSKYNMDNPCPIGEMQSISVSDYIDTYTAQATVTEIIRGDKALSMIQQANSLNYKPQAGYDYLLAKIKFKLLTNKDNKSLSLNRFSFKLYSDNNTEYDYVSVVSPKPEFDTTLYKNGEYEGYACYQVKTEDSKPKLVHGAKYDGTGGYWFKAYEDEEK